MFIEGYGEFKLTWKFWCRAGFAFIRHPIYSIRTLSRIDEHGLALCALIMIMGDMVLRDGVPENDRKP